MLRGSRLSQFTRIFTRAWALFAAAGLSGPLESSSRGQADSPSTEAAPPELAAPPADATVQELAIRCRDSVVILSVAGRDGRRQGMGTGFVVDASGLIATNLHVIGEGRTIWVQLADGTDCRVQSVHATDRSLDLAILKVDRQDLVPLPLGASSLLIQGQPVVAMGNPHGLMHSIVSGVVSGTRELDGRQMIQLAIPIEPGNSGGPLLDMQGRVQGILTMKSLITANLGFAVGIDALQPLLEHPNPIPMQRWLTIGALDPRHWQPLFGARWRQRAGRILVDGSGESFGGRALCLSALEAPPAPFELAVGVRLDDESGAAGLAFASDGGDRHFGFYPSAGELRLTKFDGPDVASWQVLRQAPSPHYRPGEWNTLKARVEEDRVLCYVNGELVFEWQGAGLSPGKAGLAKFRQTHAEFKQFQMAPELPSRAADPEIAARLDAVANALSQGQSPAAQDVEALAAGAAASSVLLRERAERLAQQAQQLRDLASAVDRRSVLLQLAEVTREETGQPDLWHAALLIARLDNEDLDVTAYRGEIQRMADEIAATTTGETSEADRLAAVNRYLFESHGYHGSRSDYYNRANSYVNEVLDDREGLPLTLGIVYIELARRLGLVVEGVGLPGHFIVRHVPAEGEPALIDVFDRGAALSLDQAKELVRSNSGLELLPEHLAPMDARAMLVRLLHNLIGVAQRSDDLPGVLRYLDAILTIAPADAQNRWARAVMRYQSRDKAGARADCDWLLEHSPADVDLDRVHELRAAVAE